MAAIVHLIQWSFFFFHLFTLIVSYKISTVDQSGVCNETIYLEEGAKSAAILRLTAKNFYDFSPLNCIITFKASQHSWSGMIGVLEEVDLRRYEDTADHHLAQNQCVDYIKVLQKDSAMPQDEQCGSWAVSGAEKLSQLGFRRSLFGFCPNPPAPGSKMTCGVNELKVQVSVGQRDFSSLRRGKPWRTYRGFTFVVTAYRYSFGESGCIEGLQSCGKVDYHGYQHHCVHKSLWCDHHINCGQPKNNDELLCHNDEMLSGLVTVMAAPWVGAAMLIVIVLLGVLYWRRARPPPPPGPPQPQDHNSYAESYEVSSTMSSAHHMAIQVRVVCNSGHGIHTPRTSPWQADLPPSYDSLFPQGPPPLKSTVTTTTTTTSSAAGFNISTTSLVSTTLGSNANVTSGPSGFFSNTTQTSSIVIPISAICNTHGSPAMSSASFSTSTFTNTVTTATPTVTNTTTSTSTIASVGASPAAMASISVTSVSLAGPPGSIMSNCSKDNNDSINPSQDNISSNSSRAQTPHNCPKSDIRENTPCIAEATPPLVEPEDTNITPCNSAGETPASAEVELLPYTFHDVAQNNANTVSELYGHLARQSCNKTSLSSMSESTMQEMERASISDKAMSLPCRLSTSFTLNEIDDHLSDISHIPVYDSENMVEEMNLEDMDVSPSLVTRVDELEPYTESNISSSHLKEETIYDNEITIPSMLATKEEDENMILKNSLDKCHALDKDNESFL